MNYNIDSQMSQQSHKIDAASGFSFHKRAKINHYGNRVSRNGNFFLSVRVLFLLKNKIVIFRVLVIDLIHQKLPQQQTTMQFYIWKETLLKDYLMKMMIMIVKLVLINCLVPRENLIHTQPCLLKAVGPKKIY
jgi:hypothetical protein